MKIICVGRNYAAHAKELSNPVEEQPVIFMKPETAVPAARQPFFYPAFSNDVHYEAELVYRICKVGKHIEERFAHKYYDAVTVGIDFTARDVQQHLKGKGLPWELAKSFDGSAPLGSFITKERLPEVLSFSLRQNGLLKQSGRSADMIFSIDRIIAFVSGYITLKKGDLIFTGTPAGVGPVFKGDVLECSLEEQHVLTVKVR